MRLDLYAGSLARYHSGNWELATQRAGREVGVTVEIDYSAPPPRLSKFFAPLSVFLWRRRIQRKYSHLIKNKLSWREGVNSPYWTEKVDHDGRNALILATAYSERPNIKPPKELPETLEADLAYASIGSEYLSSNVSVIECHMFLPSRENFLIATEDATGIRRFITSTGNLTRALQWVNDALWQASEDEIAMWASRGPLTRKNMVIERGKIVREEEIPLPEDQFMHIAQFGFAMYHEALLFSRLYWTPILTDQ